MAKICAVFGGSRGIGKEIARKLLREGHHVAVLSRNGVTVEKSVDELKCEGSRIIGEVCNVSKEKEVVESILTIQKKLGQINVLVNCAGINIDKLLLKTNVSDIQGLLATNLVGSMLTSKAILKGMIVQKYGTIINVGSIVGSVGNIGQTLYSASKSGLVGFTKSLAKEVASRGITVNIIAPGYILTDMTHGIDTNQIEKLIPLGRLGTGEEVADAVSFLIRARYITGQVIPVDGGLTLNT